MKKSLLLILAAFILVGFGVWRTVDAGYYVAPKLNLVVNSATIKYTGQENMGNVDLQANVSPLSLSTYTTISAYVDGITLFSAPFWKFKALEDDGPGSYQYKDKDLLVKLNTVYGVIKVMRQDLSLAGINNANGVEFKISIGSRSGTQVLTMTEEPGKKLTYAP